MATMTPRLRGAVRRSERPAPRRFRVFMPDRGARWVDPARDQPARVAAILQEVVECGFWRELDRFPVSAIARALPLLRLPRHTQRLLEIWVEERGV